MNKCSALSAWSLAEWLYTVVSVARSQSMTRAPSELIHSSFSLAVETRAPCVENPGRAVLHKFEIARLVS